MGLLHGTAARTGLQRGTHRLVVRAACALLALRGSALGYGHSGSLRLRAEFVLECLERLPPGIRGRLAVAGGLPGVQVFPTLRAQPFAIVPADHVLRGRE